jgi:hypothetical protein
VTYQVIDNEFGNVVGEYASMFAAFDALVRELAAGGSVAGLTIIHWSGDHLNIALRGEDIQRREPPQGLRALAYYTRSVAADDAKPSFEASATAELRRPEHATSAPLTLA